MKIKYIVNAVKWWDKVNGNTYHSVRVTRCEDGKQLVGPMQYGYGDHYRQTALEIMGYYKPLTRGVLALPTRRNHATSC